MEVAVNERCSARPVEGQLGDHDFWQYRIAHIGLAFCSGRFVLSGADSTVLHVRIDESVVRAVCSNWIAADVGGGCDIHSVWDYVGVCTACRHQHKLMIIS